MDGLRLLLVVATLATATIAPPIHAQPAKPSFIIFLADDLGFHDAAFQGNSDVETPRLDALAAESVQFENFYVHPTCAPTRASLLTGKFFLKTGVWGVHGTRDFMGLEEKTFADVLGDEGYKTGIYGKWHSGTTDGYLPWDRGFQEGCTTHLYDYLDSKVLCNGKLEFTKGWTTKNIADWSIDFIKRNAGEPFVLYVPFMAPHLGVTVPLAEYNWQAPKSYIQKYRKKGQREPVARLHALINFMDFQIGRILDAMDKAKISDDTVVMFMSDNGADAKERFTEEEWAQRNAGMAGEKGKVAENAIRSPLLIRYPRTFDPAVVGDPVVAVEDIYPTMLDMAGIEAKDVDGKSLVPLLENPELKDVSWMERFIFRTLPAPWWTETGGEMFLLPNKGLDKSGLKFGANGEWAVRQGKFKYVNSSGKESVWDVVSDPSESKDVGDEKLKSRLRNSVRTWWNEVVADPQSFTVPSFILGRSGASKVPAMGAVSKTLDFITRTHIVQGDYTHPGSNLEYRISVEKQGTYTVTARIKAKGSWKGKAKFTINCEKGKEAVFESGTTQGAWANEMTFGEMEIPFTGKDCSMVFKVTEGVGTLNLYWFSFQREGAKDGAVDLEDESVQAPAPPAAPPAKPKTDAAAAKRKNKLRARRRAARLAKSEAVAKETENIADEEDALTKMLELESTTEEGSGGVDIDEESSTNIKTRIKEAKRHPDVDAEEPSLKEKNEKKRNEDDGEISKKVG